MRGLLYVASVFWLPSTCLRIGYDLEGDSAQLNVEQAANGKDSVASGEEGYGLIPKLLNAVDNSLNKTLIATGICCGNISEFLESEEAKSATGPLAFVLGNQFGPCCRGYSTLVQPLPGFEHGEVWYKGELKDKIGVSANKHSDADWSKKIYPSTSMALASASKWVSSFVILSLVNNPKYNLDLETPVHTILPWWTQNQTDPRYAVTIKDLLTMTSHFTAYKKVHPEVCSEKPRTTMACAKRAHDVSYHVDFGEPGEKFVYGETHWFILGAVAMTVTGADSYNEVFRSTVAAEVGMSEDCYFVEDPDFVFTRDPGAALRCSADDYGKFLLAVAKKRILQGNSTLIDEAEKPHTKGKKRLSSGGLPIPGFFHYGFGHWFECADADCSASNTMKMSSIGSFGSFPWITRTPTKVTWGIITRTDPGKFQDANETEVHEQAPKSEKVFWTRVLVDSLKLYHGLEDHRTESQIYKKIEPKLPERLKSDF